MPDKAERPKICSKSWGFPKNRGCSGVGQRLQGVVSTIFEAQLALKAYWISASSYQKHTGLLIVLLAKGFFAGGGPGR